MKFIFSSWFSISVLIALILFIPYKVSILTFKPYDFWIFFLLVYNSNKILIPRGNLAKILLIISFLSVISTYLQASKDSLYFDLVFFSHFYRYFRLILILAIVKTLVRDSYSITKVVNSFYLLGFVTILISIIQIINIAPLANFFNNLYVDEEITSSLVGYGLLERFGGIMGNPNSMAILLSSFGGVAIAKITYLRNRIFSKVFSISYFISIFIIVVIFTSSRTSVIVLLIMLSIWLYIVKLKKSIYFVTLLLIPLIFISSKENFDDYENLNRVYFLFENKTSEGNEADIVELTGRENLWQDRIDVFFKKGHDLSLFVGMGFTKLYYDYADNGLLSFFINLGIIGLLLKILFYVIILKLIYYFFKSNTDYIKLSTGLIITALFLFEFSAETIDHIKIGPLFILFLQLGFQINEKSISFYNN